MPTPQEKLITNLLWDGRLARAILPTPQEKLIINLLWDGRLARPTHFRCKTQFIKLCNSKERKMLLIHRCNSNTFTNNPTQNCNQNSAKSLIYERSLDRIVIERPRSGLRLSSRRIKGQKKSKKLLKLPAQMDCFLLI